MTTGDHLNHKYWVWDWKYIWWIGKFTNAEFVNDDNDEDGLNIFTYMYSDIYDFTKNKMWPNLYIKYTSQISLYIKICLDLNY